MRSRLEIEKMEPSRVGTDRMLPDDELLNSVRPYSVRCKVLADIAVLARCLPHARLVIVVADPGEYSLGAIDGALEAVTDGGTDGGRAARKSSRSHSGTSELS